MRGAGDPDTAQLRVSFDDFASVASFSFAWNTLAGAAELRGLRPHGVHARRLHGHWLTTSSPRSGSSSRPRRSMNASAGLVGGLAALPGRRLRGDRRGQARSTPERRSSSSPASTTTSRPGAVHPRRDPRPGSGPRVRRRRAPAARRVLAGFLADEGRFADAFERASRAGSAAVTALLTNSGSIGEPGRAVAALTSPKLGDRALKPGDEVITVAAGFPTTVNPIIQNGLVPVFVDVRRRRRTTSTSTQLEAAICAEARAR